MKKVSKEGGRLAWITIGLLVAIVSAPAAGEEAAVAGEEEPKAWDARIAAGLSLREGDESNFTANGDVMVGRRWTADTLTFRGLADYGKSGGDTLAENYGATLTWRRDLTERFFWRTVGGLDSDQVQGRSLRATIGTGPGYRIWEASENEFLDFWGSLGYRYERFRSHSRTPDNNLVDLGLGYDYHDVWKDVVEIVHSTGVFTPLNDAENFLARTEATLSVPLFSGLHFRTNTRYEYVNEPAAGAKSSNWWFSLGLEYRL